MGTPRGLQAFRTDLEELISSSSLAWLAARRRGKQLLNLATSLTPQHAANRPGLILTLAA
jgi:hypothetical protein